MNYRNLLEAYPQLLGRVRANGRDSAPRGQKVTEHKTPLIWTLERPWEWALTIPGRRLNPFFALAEVVWMWSGKGGIEFISYYNKTIANFGDEGVPYFNAAYGKRIRHAGYDERPFRELPYLITPGLDPHPVDVDQLAFAIKKLEADPETRQAAISLWDPVKDNFTKSKDHPCNNMVYLSQRDGKLNCTVVIRSNDLIWGVPYNMVQFVHLQALAAGRLGYGMGQFTVMCNNLHFYHDLYPDTLKLVHDWTFNLQDRRISLSNLSDELFAPVDGSYMTWSLDRFDGFVRNVWEPMDKELRYGFENNATGAWMSARWIKLKDFMSMNSVPAYWQAVFATLFMYHLRKCKCFDLANDIHQVLPADIKWLVSDFINKSTED